LSKIGVEIIRFNDQEIFNNIEVVYEIVQRVIEKKIGNPPSPPSSPHRGRGSKGEKKLPSTPF
jgi:hypothetical protein